MELFNQMLEGLQTGGIGAKIPIIQSALEQARAGQSNAMRETQESLSTSGLAGTPFGQRTLAGARVQGESNISAIPTNIIQSFLAGAPGFASQTAATGMQGLSAVTGSEAAIRAAQIQAVASMYNSTISAAGSAAGAAICWLAAMYYGIGTTRFKLAKRYIMETWRGPIAWLCRKLYHRYGLWLTTRPSLSGLLRPLFDIAVARQQRLEAQRWA